MHFASDDDEDFQHTYTRMDARRICFLAQNVYGKRGSNLVHMQTEHIDCHTDIRFTSHSYVFPLQLSACLYQLSSAEDFLSSSRTYTLARARARSLMDTPTCLLLCSRALCLSRSRSSSTDRMRKRLVSKTSIKFTSKHCMCVVCTYFHVYVCMHTCTFMYMHTSIS